MQRWPVGAAVVGVAMLAWPAAVAHAQGLQAQADAYAVANLEDLIVEGPGVLDNDTLDGEDLPGTAEAELVSSVNVGTLTCESNSSLDLCPDGSFVYSPDPSFVGNDSFVYRVVDGTSVSNSATVTITVEGCAGGPAVYSCWVESAYLAKLAELGFSTYFEGFEDEAAWSSARSPNTAASITSRGVTWTSNNAVSEVTTGTGPARTGVYGFFTLPHGDPTGGPTDPLRDGFVGTWRAAGDFRAVGGWLDANTGGAQVRFALDGVEHGFIDPALTSQHRFFGVIDADGFKQFEIFETEGVVEDQEFIFGDDFTLAFVAPGVPAAGTWGLLALGGAMLGSGAACLRARRRTAR